MRLGLSEGWAARRRKVAVCPQCSSVRARTSRRRYDGPWALFLTVRPVKCSDCGAYFAVAAGGSPARAETGAVDLDIPLRPAEFGAPAKGCTGPLFEGVAGEAPRPRPSRRACPVCGSDEVRASRSGIERPNRLLDVKIDYRCVHCNAAFRRTSPLRLLVLSLLLLSVFAGLGSLAIATLGGGPISKPPRILKDQIKEPPPPVFR